MLWVEHDNPNEHVCDAFWKQTIPVWVFLFVSCNADTQTLLMMTSDILYMGCISTNKVEMTLSFAHVDEDSHS